MLLVRLKQSTTSLRCLFHLKPKTSNLFSKILLKTIKDDSMCILKVWFLFCLKHNSVTFNNTVKPWLSRLVTPVPLFYEYKLITFANHNYFFSIKQRNCRDSFWHWICSTFWMMERQNNINSIQLTQLQRMVELDTHTRCRSEAHQW